MTINFWSRFGVNGNLLFLKQPLFKDSVDKKHYIKILALNNVRSLPNEPFMTPRTDNLQRLKFGADIFLGRGGWGWARIASSYLTLKDYNFPQESILTGQDAIINKTISVVADEKTIAFVFDTIKNIMKWNGKISSVPSAGLRDTWQKKTGNSTDINLILLHFLRAAGVSAFPTLVATKNFGTIRYGDPDPYIINNTVITIPIDSNKNYYVLDASNKYSLYTDVPVSVLNTYGVMIDPDKMYERLIMLAGKTPARQITTIDADVQRDGKMTATVSITSSSYHKSELLRLFNKLDQKTYLDSAFAAGNKIKVNSFKIDSVKDNNELLSQEISFTTDLNSGNDKYLYLNTTLFSRIGDNPFKNEHRFCDIDLLFNTDYGLNGVYKIPEGYKIDALPKSITLIMTDRSIVFKRTVNFDNGSISVRYSIQNGKSAYKAEEYPSLRDFYKKMYELLNEQIVLKKQ